MKEALLHPTLILSYTHIVPRASLSHIDQNAPLSRRTPASRTVRWDSWRPRSHLLWATAAKRGSLDSDTGTHRKMRKCEKMKWSACWWREMQWINQKMVYSEVPVHPHSTSRGKHLEVPYPCCSCEFSTRKCSKYKHRDVTDNRDYEWKGIKSPHALQWKVISFGVHTHIYAAIMSNWGADKWTVYFIRHDYLIFASTTRP